VIARAIAAASMVGVEVITRSSSARGARVGGRSLGDRVLDRRVDGGHADDDGSHAEDELGEHPVMVAIDLPEHPFFIATVFQP
jgi:hypothetical protein